ncbi:MotA/TolQ/ExbB proton channel family protein [SAR92 clade bacterium H921]|jgi:chemotaxis protein MotA|nr:MotA/TolQ/ExbB proton channel family protein [SAR92 clade bacterium H921]MDA9664405.1 MotA/TolQ/ExbB proton channel family protein [bacterium]MDG0972515.1 MotA/TolQ/ExbB proton channel family protein [Porticoccaceae bacterium]MDG1307843.1 MotA/TolQ/ExbB proton channel family protein [Porticoccaceae bacterium]
MDIATIVGLLGAFGLIFLAIDDMAAFIDTASMLIVVGGSIMVVMFRSSLGEFLGAVGVMAKTFKNKLDAPETLIEQIVELATIARKDGMIALEGQEIANPFLSKAVAMLVDGADATIIKGSLEREKSMTAMRHAMGAKIFSAWGEIAPAMGMIGTLIGLVQMLGNMSDPKAIGPAMAVALLTTMYGAILANVICLPIAMKLENQADLEEANNELIIEGILFIQDGGNPRVLSDFLAAFLSPKARAKLAPAA